VLKGVTGPERGYLIVASNGQVAGAAGSIGNLVFRSGERMPIIVLGAASARGASAAPSSGNEKAFDPPGLDTTTGSSDHTAPWTVAGHDLLVSTAPVQPGLVVVALAPAPGLIAALMPIIGLALVPIGFCAVLLALLWRQGRALARSESERAASEELAEIVTTSAGCGLIDWDVDGGKIYWSAALMGLVGRASQGAWLTLPETYQLMHPTEVPKLDRLRLAIAEGAPFIETLVRLQSLQGRTIWCEARLRAWQDSEGQRIVGLLVDITSEVEARIEAEAAAPEGFREDPNLRATIEELEQKRTELADITQRHASEHTRAEDASRAKNEFLAHMSHELKTPLNAIIGFSEIMHSELYGTIGDERYREYARDIHAAGRALSQLIDDILEMSKIETGRVNLDLEALDLVEIAETCVRLVEPRARETSIHIENRIKDAPAAMGDRRATKRILMSLLSNAVKFTQRGGRITLSASVDADNVTLMVADNGIGISQGDLSRIGRPFEQVENHQSRRHRGTGLGLAISMALSEMQGGALKIESAEGVGTTVYVSLPRQSEESEAPSARRFGKAG
jgi:signal transduction histidine kinase